MKKNFLILLMGLTLQSPLWAYGEKGNGGDAVVCDDGTVRLLDFYEAQKADWDIKIEGTTLAEKVKTLQKRFPIEGFSADKEKYRGNTYLGNNRSNFYFRDNKIVDILIKAINLRKSSKTSISTKDVRMTGDILTDIPDSFETSIPKNCTKQQLVIRNTMVFPGDPQFEIRLDLLKKMNLDNLAMLITQETYLEFFNDYDTDSRLSRYFNRLTAQADASQRSAYKYIYALRDREEKLDNVTFSLDFSPKAWRWSKIYINYEYTVGLNNELPVKLLTTDVDKVELGSKLFFDVFVFLIVEKDGDHNYELCQGIRYNVYKVCSDFNLPLTGHVSGISLDATGEYKGFDFLIDQKTVEAFKEKNILLGENVGSWNLIHLDANGSINSDDIHAIGK